ncbi:MAG: AAA family ATPase, partial [Planctomycetaceae bacterium]|nr:AAA family ATPase [Planctomycetaceae bacterium]
MQQSTNSAADGRQMEQRRIRNLEDNPPLRHLAELLPLHIISEDNCEPPYPIVLTPSLRRLLDHLQLILQQSRQHHALLIGAKGSGKTSVLQLFAQEMLVRRPDIQQIVYLDSANVGIEDSRAVLETLFSGLRSHQPAVLLIDNICSLLNRPGGGTNKPLIRSIMARSGLHVIASMQESDFNEQIANDVAMLDSFDQVWVPLFTEEELLAITTSYCDSLGSSRGISLTPSLPSQTLAMTSTFLLSELEPLRSLRVLDLAADQLQFRLAGGTDQCLSLTDVASVVSRRSGIPVETILGQTKTRDFASALATAVVGQPDAVREVAIELELIAAGLNEPHKPATVLMFAGMTGVGKTELAKRVARLYSPSGRLKVYPMGNFTEQHSVSG